MQRPYTCRMCGHTAQGNEGAPASEAESLCHKCGFWMEKVRWAETGTTEAGNPVARHGGVHYVLKPYALDSVPRRDLGLNGAVMTFAFRDGREVTSNNVWVQGIIPELWRPLLPDNAEIVRPARATGEALAS